MRTAILTLLASMALVAMSCADDPALDSRSETEKGTPGEWPVGRVVDHLEFGDISFDPAPGTPWTNLVDLSVFDGFWPGMTGEEAVAAIGPADEHYERGGERYWLYREPGVEIAVALKDKGSFLAGRWWRLEAKFDPPVNPGDLFHPSVVQSLPEADSRYSIVIMNNEGKPGVSALVEDGQVVAMDWINNPGSSDTGSSLLRSGR